MEFKSERHHALDMRHPDKQKRIAPAPKRVRPHFLGRVSLMALGFFVLFALSIPVISFWAMVL